MCGVLLPRAARFVSDPMSDVLEKGFYAFANEILEVLAVPRLEGRGGRDDILGGATYLTQGRGLPSVSGGVVGVIGVIVIRIRCTVSPFWLEGQDSVVFGACSLPLTVWEWVITWV